MVRNRVEGNHCEWMVRGREEGSKTDAWSRDVIKLEPGNVGGKMG